MLKNFKIITISIIVLLVQSISFSNNNFFNDALKLYENKKYGEARFLFERNIVFNPKDSTSYLYLAKIYNHEEDQRKEIINFPFRPSPVLS